MKFIYVLSSASIATAYCGVKLQNLVTFGDSITDEGRLNYIVTNGKLPPPGTLLPESRETASGGYSWPRFVQQKTGAKTDLDFDLYNGGRHADNTVYTLWVGTNDIGEGGFMKDKNVPGTTLSDYVDCNWEVFDAVYKTGGRHFVLSKVFPLDQSPLYNPQERGGLEAPSFWPDKATTNATQYYHKLIEYSTSINTMFAYGVPFQLLVEKRWPGATVYIFDVHKLMTDVLDNPQEYLEAPANTTGVYHFCTNPDPRITEDCIDSEESPTVSCGLMTCIHQREWVRDRDTRRGVTTVWPLNPQAGHSQCWGNTLDIAIAMLETERLSTDYAYGDNKSNDAANFGLFKQNWGMLRVCGSRGGFKGQSESQWNNGNRLNWDIYADVAARWDCQNYYGYEKWFAGHRNGATGLNNPNTDDIRFYRTSVEWIQQQIDSQQKYRSDDTRFWVDVTPI
ncbi:unnamed protein product [Parascedosporium putredinis]|uniref:Uncharacterized protein n=1 Tax=Parascedosporium putredinis TaxID=1442378 RepID=A0A9P1HDS5_9PEZI|nr:unnamed protein product [Parascedosporium putredinis]CAI8004316.1 unnamed protein product [Parascedosporium putredinis]